MKNKIIGIFALLFMVGSVSAIENCDVDGNGVEDLSDAVYLSQLVGMDLNGDGVVNTQDATILNEAIAGNTCHSKFWELLFPVVVEEPEEEQSHGRSHAYHRDLNNNRNVKYYDSMGYNNRRFLLNHKEYYLDMTWSKYWFFGWKASDDVLLTIRDSDYEVIKKLNVEEEGTFNFAGETIGYETDERSVPVKKIKMWMEE